MFVQQNLENKNQRFNIFNKEVTELSMSNNQQLREQLIHYFRAVGSGENMIQCIKEVLFLHEHFNPVLLFERLSRGKQRISSKNWRDYLISINLQFNEREFKYFIKHNNYKSQVTLNEFLQSIIPYNGDVVRQYKQKCNQSIKISESNKEVNYIFAELIENQFKLFRILINIRDSISAIAGLRDIEELVKRDLLQDLEKNNLAREHRKLQETFEQKGFKLGFSEVRKFFKIWVPQKVIIHELCMLNVMRHLKSNDPFCRIIFNKKRNANKNNALKRSRSRSANEDEEHQYLSNQKRGQKIQQSPYSKHLLVSDLQDKYANFKERILDQFHEKKMQTLYKQGGNKSYKKENLHSADKQLHRRAPQFQQNRNFASSYKKDSQHQGQNIRLSYEGDYILRFLQEIIVKEQKLQRLRKQLAKKEDFNLINLYKLIDYKNKGFVTSKDINEFPDVEKAQYIHMVNFFGRQNDKLLFHEFCQIFRPLSRQLNEAIDTRPQSKIPDPFKRQTRRLILQIFKVTAQLHFNIQRMREGMRKINPKSMFNSLDVHNKGYIDSQALLTVFKQNDIYCDDKTLKCLMKLFRKRIDEKITFNELAKFIEA